MTCAAPVVSRSIELRLVLVLKPGGCGEQASPGRPANPEVILATTSIQAGGLLDVLVPRLFADAGKPDPAP